MEIMKWAKKSSTEILQELNLTEPPFNPFEIAEKMGVNVKDDLDWDKVANDGMIYLDKNGNPEIWINPFKPLNRQKFTLAHELGHLVYDVLPNIDKFKDPILDTYTTMYRNGSRSHTETTANRFAGNLLLPVEPLADSINKLIEKAGGRDKISIRNIIDALSAIFEVSKDAIIVRLKQLKAVEQNYDYYDETAQALKR